MPFRDREGKGVKGGCRCTLRCTLAERWDDGGENGGRWSDQGTTSLLLPSHLGHLFLTCPHLPPLHGRPPQGERRTQAQPQGPGPGRSRGPEGAATPGHLLLPSVLSRAAGAECLTRQHGYSDVPNSHITCIPEGF